MSNAQMTFRNDEEAMCFLFSHGFWHDGKSTLGEYDQSELDIPSRLLADLRTAATMCGDNVRGKVEIYPDYGLEANT